MLLLLLVRGNTLHRVLLKIFWFKVGPQPPDMWVFLPLFLSQNQEFVDDHIKNECLLGKLSMFRIGFLKKKKKLNQQAWYGMMPTSSRYVKCVGCELRGKGHMGQHLHVLLSTCIPMQAASLW